MSQPSSSIRKQHLIDPEVCIRCNTCEESCPIGAVTHNDDNYVVDVSICNFCMACVAPCPTGAIDNWRVVSKAWTLEEQFEWEELPGDADISAALSVQSSQQNEGDEDVSSSTSVDVIDEEVTAIFQQVKSLRQEPVAPSTAAKPQVGLYSRKNPAEAVVTGNFRITTEGFGSDVRHIILDFNPVLFPVLEGQSVGIIPPGTDASGKPHHIRLYSVASPRDGERLHYNNLALTVKRVTSGDTAEAGGVCSNYLCDLKKGDKVKVLGPYGEAFLMPNHPEANLIMICTGTGSAPFRAMTEYCRRYPEKRTGKLLLFFGARTPEELPYFGPLKKLPPDFIDQELVFSRWTAEGKAMGKKEYVQDRMLQRSEDLFQLLQDENTYVYICGLKEMEAGVQMALEKIFTAHELNWEAHSENMIRTGRYHIETY